MYTLNRTRINTTNSTPATASTLMRKSVVVGASSSPWRKVNNTTASASNKSRTATSSNKLAAPTATSSSSSSTGTSSAIAGLTPAQQVQLQLQNIPENPTPEAKLRHIFKEMSQTNEGNVSKTVKLVGFERVLKILNIEFSNETVLDLFERADINGQGYIDYSEFLHFAQHYPLLVEAIYARSREVFVQAARDAEVETAREKLSVLQQKEQDQQEKLDEAKYLVEEQQRRFEIAQDASRNAEQGAKDRSKEANTADADLERAKANGAVTERRAKDAQEAEREAQKPIRGAERNIELQTARLASAEVAVETTTERVRQLENLLEEAKRDAQSAADVVVDAQDGLVEMREHHSELMTLLADAMEETEKAVVDHREAGTEIRMLREKLKEAELAKAEAIEFSKQLVVEADGERKACVPFREREEVERQKHVEAHRLYEEYASVVSKMERESEMSSNNRSEAEAAELPLLENEVRLREQRANINMRDDVLWDEGGHFLKANGRSDTRKGTTQGRTRGI